MFFGLTLKNFWHRCSKNYSLYINAVKITVFQRRNNVIWSTLYQRRNFTSKQRWFWVETKNNFVLMLWSLRDCNFFIDVEKITLFQRWNNVILSTLNQRWNLALKKHWFWVDTKKFLLLLYYDVQGIIMCLSKWYMSFNIETTSLCQRQFNVKILRWSNVDFGLALETNLFLYVMILEDCNLDNDAEKIAVFQRRKNVILSTLNQRQNLT